MRAGTIGMTTYIKANGIKTRKKGGWGKPPCERRNKENIKPNAKLTIQDGMSRNGKGPPATK